MKLYVAGGWLEKEAISAMMRRLEAAGHIITCDWTAPSGHDTDKPCGNCEGRGQVLLSEMANDVRASACVICLGRGKVPKTSDADLTPEERLKFARLDLKGVYDADLVWHIVANYRGSRGAYVEMGYALALRRPVIVSGPDWPKSIFCELAQWKFSSHEDALALLTKYGTVAQLLREGDEPSGPSDV